MIVGKKSLRRSWTCNLLIFMDYDNDIGAVIQQLSRITEVTIALSPTGEIGDKKKRKSLHWAVWKLKWAASVIKNL